MGMLDKALNLCSAMAYNGTPAIVDLGIANPGPGYQIKGRLQMADAEGMSALVIKTGATSGTATTTLATIPCTFTQANAGFNFTLPPAGLLQFVTVSFTGLSAGTVTDCSLMLDHQTAQ